jgi:hypothetical protein
MDAMFYLLANTDSIWIGAHRECLGAVRTSTRHPEVQGLASLHNDAWRQGVATGVHDCFFKVVLHIAQLY